MTLPPFFVSDCTMTEPLSLLCLWSFSIMLATGGMGSSVSVSCIDSLAMASTWEFANHFGRPRLPISFQLISIFSANLLFPFYAFVLCSAISKMPFLVQCNALGRTLLDFVFLVLS